MNTEPQPVAEPASADGDETELTRLRDENTELRQTARFAAAREVLNDALRSSGASSPALLFETARGDLQFADDGTLTNAAAITASLKARYPEQFGSGRPLPIDGGAGRTELPALTKESLAKMSPDEIARLDWATVREVLAKG